MERFSDMYIPVTESGCWLWLGNTHSGYGRFRINPKEIGIGAHRASFILHKGEIPKGLLVCHKCDIRECVNPSHLFLGTYKENMQDASKKGRMNWKKPVRDELPKGEAHSQSKLTDESVRHIRNSELSGIELSKKFGVSNNSITRVRKRHTWRHIP